MLKTAYLVIFVSFLSICSFAQSRSVLGHWKGVKMKQNKISSSDVFFLPNEGEMILTEDKVKLYYYPYFKSDEYDVVYRRNSFFYTIGEKDIQSKYSFRGDTLVFEMNYINKVFVKFFLPVELDQEVVNDLDQFGFRTNRLTKPFEVDTFRNEQKIGFKEYDSLGFDPIQTIAFQKDNMLLINGNQKVAYKRKYKRIVFKLDGKEQELGVSHMKGTEDIHLIPLTDCQCDSIVIPYMTVNWANRIRQAIIDEENF